MAVSLSEGGRVTVRTSGKAMCWRVYLAVAGLPPLLCGAGPPDQPNLQEVQVAGRVLHFEATQPSGPITLAVVYNPADRDSYDEAVALAALLGNGLTVGDLTLQPVLVKQARLTDSASYGAIFATIGVDEDLLAAALREHHVPCLTRHLEQVAHGACTVAITSNPSVNIVLSAANALAAGVRFATAFRMMVQEL